MRHENLRKVSTMRAILVPAAFALGVTAIALSATPAPAAGCLKGAVVGGAAGHFAGHHGLLGAGAGCLIGRHEANKHSRERAERERAYERGYSKDPAAALRPASFAWVRQLDENVSSFGGEKTPACSSSRRKAGIYVWDRHRPARM
jgi:hypothetical protein